MITLWLSEDGQDLVEYALILALIIVACVGGITLLGDSISKVWGEADSRLTNEL